MEPFGVFQFLQSLLNSPAPTQENPSSPTFQNTEEPPPAENKNISPVLKNNDAYIQFISAHESRVKRTRK